MHTKSLFVLLVTAAVLVSSEPPPEGGHGGYRGPPTKIKPSGPSKIFGWLGSRFAKIPHFLPKFPQFPKYHVPHKLPSYQAAIVLPQHPSTSGSGSDYSSHGHGHQSQQQVPEKVEITQTADQGHNHNHNYEETNSYQDQNQGPQQDYYPQDQNNNDNGYGSAPGPPYDFIPEFKANDGIEVVQSQLLSYNKEVIPPNSGWQNANGGNGYDQGASPAAPVPISAPPLYNHIQGGPSKNFVKHVPVVPQSTGPDYFNTAYGGNQGGYRGQQQHGYIQQQQQNVQNQWQPILPKQQQQQVYQQQQHAPVQNYGATFTEIRPQSQSGKYNDGGFDFGQQGPPAAPSPSYIPSQQQPQQQLQPQYQAPHSSAGGFTSSGIPGVQILSQSEDGGNPVFEVLTDANAPDFNGHPFDINKLIAMIEPGAELTGAPELSQAASETKNVYSEPGGGGSGIGDLLISASDPVPSDPVMKRVPNSTKTPLSSFLIPNKNPNTDNSTDLEKGTSSLKEIMDFFSQTGGKGYVIVEKKRSRPNRTQTDETDSDDDLDDDLDLTDGVSRVNITSENLPLLARDNKDFIHDLDKPAKKDKLSSGPINKLFPKYSNANANKQYPLVPKSRATTTTTTTESPTPITTSHPPMVFFAVRATTRHPNHNYYSPNSPLPVSSAQSPPFNSFLDMVDRDWEGDLSPAESIKSIAITVTPPPRLGSVSQTTPTPVTVTEVVPVTSTNKTLTASTKKRPSPVYKAKSN